MNSKRTILHISRFADGSGDSNPLWRHEKYGGGTRYGSIITHPSWVLSVLAGIQFGWRGLAGLHSARDMEFYKPVKLNEKTGPEETFTYPVISFI